MLHHAGTSELYTQRLHLRPYRPGDETAMFRNWASDPEVTRFMTWEPHASPAVTKGLVDMWVEGYESPTVYRWGIEKDGELVGDISVVRWNEEDAWCEIGYCLCRRLWGQGLMTEALSRVQNYLFDTVGFHRIVLRHDSRNPASGRVMQKCGMTYEGTSRECKLDRSGTWIDVCNYAILEGDRPQLP